MPLSYYSILFVGARNGHFPTMFSLIQVSKLSPTPSLVFMVKKIIAHLHLQVLEIPLML
jgi:hypothetical protein